MDAYQNVRSIPLMTTFGWLGIDVSQFKKRNGKDEWFGKCPYHESVKNQTSFSFTRELGHCFSCNIKFKGSIDAVKEFKKVNFTEAVAFLQSQSQAQPPAPAGSSESGTIQSGELKPFKGTYHKNFKPCEWLDKRIPFKHVLDTYGVGYYDNPARSSAYSKKVMLPLKGFSDGEVYGYLARSIRGEDVKYLFPKGFPKHEFLFGAHELKEASSLPLRVVYVVEYNAPRNLDHGIS